MRGRPKTIFKRYPVSEKTITLSAVATSMGLAECTIYRALMRNRAHCVEDGHAIKVEGRWELRASILTAFRQDK